MLEPRPWSSPFNCQCSCRLMRKAYENTGQEPVRILAVDDEGDVRGFYQAVFRAWQPQAQFPAAGTDAETSTVFELSVCAQGPEAVEAVQKAVEKDDPFAVVFLDLQLPPGPDGIWTAERIREVDADVNIVIVTGRTGAPLQDIAGRVPPVDKLLYVEKPLHSREIEQIAVALAARWRAERLLRSSFAALEARVAERTAELTAANEALRQKVAEIKRAEAERAQLVSAIEQTSEGILLTDLTGRILYVNPAFQATTGYACDEAVGEQARRFVNDESDRHTYRAVAKKVLAGDRWNGVVRKRRKDGATYDAEVTVSPVRDESGHLVNYVAVFRDVTRETELERRLRHAEKMEAIGTLAGGIAHDFNNILGGIIGLAECALGRKETDERVAECLSEILGAGKRGAALTKQILTFSRRTEHQHTPMHVQPVLRDALALLRSSLPSTIEICEVVDPECGLINADPSQIHQVIMNLCTNAFHALEDTGGLLEVRLEETKVGRARSARPEGLRPGTYVLLSVADDGLGMDDETLRRVFEPYFTTKVPGRGTGLGLATAHGIVHNNRGAIVARSSPGRGSRFSVYLPLCDPEHLRTPEPVPEADALAGNERVLLVDDEEILVKSGKALFEAYGYRVTATVDSVEALGVFRDAPDAFDVVVTDQTMPQLTGSDLARELLALRPDIPIVLTTGFSETISPDDARRIGIREYVPKPAGASDLVGAVRRAIGLGAPLA